MGLRQSRQPCAARQLALRVSPSQLRRRNLIRIQVLIPVVKIKPCLPTALLGLGGRHSWIIHSTNTREPGR
jgi:hypothetical protein